ncbi:Hypothetical protein PHPALM_4401 [Phytophthora palmivora]|uniref:Uncharacterized protein n=1 Tax=Phytophthora palmivora TaxID=4796 RepID=A0A2P4YJZ9_9STRA|nr:Hypothetical protein PHPALM_4401 [Phytophthora palmivora]
MQFELTRDWNYDMTFLESSDATIIPFGFDEACHALSLALLENSCERHRFDGVDDPENTAALTYHLDFSRELGDGATLVIHHVVRRYVEEDRVVFVWRALTEGQGTFKGLSTDETAWYVLRGTTDAGEGFDLALDNDVRGNEFVKILIKADEEDADNITQIFARMLVDDVQTS